MISASTPHSPAHPALSPAAYEELRAIARHLMQAERAGHTLQPTALVHEAFLRLGAQRAAPQNNEHLRANTRLMMRRVLSNHARDRAAEKRGGGRARAQFDPDTVPAPIQNSDADRLGQALKKIERSDPRAAELVKLHYLRGVPLTDAADRLGVSLRTASRILAAARTALQQLLINGTLNTEGSK